MRESGDDKRWSKQQGAGVPSVRLAIFDKPTLGKRRCSYKLHHRHVRDGAQVHSVSLSEDVVLPPTSQGRGRMALKHVSV